MHSCLIPRDPLSIMDTYTRELVLVATRGNAEYRSLFLNRYSKYLGGAGAWMASLPNAVQAQFLCDALRCQEGLWPHTALGQRVALPKWFRPRVEDPWKSWRELQGYQPEGIVLDPMCLMLLDPDKVYHTSFVRGETVYFCCPMCKAAYEGDPSPPSLAEAA